MVRHIIVGAGIAGRRAASVIRERDSGVEIVMIDQGRDPFYYRPMLGEMIARDWTSQQLATKDKDRLLNLGIQLLQGTGVVSIDPRDQALALSNGEQFHFDKLLIASGRKTARHPLDDGTISGIAYLDTLDDAEAMSSSLQSIGKALVFGASLHALSAIRGLRGRGIDCTLVLSEDRFWPGVLDPTASQIVEDRLLQERVTVVKKDAIGELIVRDSVLKGVITQKGEEFTSDLLVVAAPQVPVMDFLQQGEFALGGGIEVDGSLRTKAPNIYAAGDVAVLPSILTGVPGPQPGWVSAWKQGALAGRNMLGEASEYSGFSSLRARFLDLDIVCLGMSDPVGEGFQEAYGDYPYEELPSIYKKIVYQGGKTVGAIMTGDTCEAGVVEGWIRRGLKKDECDSRVLDQMFLPRIREIVAIGARCPVCKFEIQVGKDHEDGAVLTCPACGVDFEVRRMPNGAFRAEWLDA